MAHSFHSPGWKEMTNGGGHPNNGNQAGGSNSTTRYLLKKQHRHRRRSSSPMGRVILINVPFDGGDDSEDLHTVTVDKSPDGRLGFSVRGGSEHGLGIFVSKVEDDCPAAQAGLTVGDKLVEVNGVSLESITMSSAVKVLTGNNRLRMVVRRVGKIPGIRFSKEKTTWVDLIHRRMVVEENGHTPSEASSDSALRRIIHLFTTSDDYCLGFNIRGGKEFGLGIYVSKLDPGGLAEQHGIKMGDQILAANGVSFDDITHSSAVEVLKSHTHVMLTIREAGRYPAYKEMVAEYGWLDQLANGGPPPSSRGSDSYSSASSMSSGTPLSSLSGVSRVLFPPVYGSEMVDSAISTEGNHNGAHKTTDSAVQTEPLKYLRPPSLHSVSRTDRFSPSETSRTVGATLLLKDSVIHGKGEGPWESGRAVEDAVRDSPKTAALVALSRPRKPIRRSQSHITTSEEKKKKKQQQKKSNKESSLKRSKTFVNQLFRKDRKEKSRSKSPSRHDDREKEKSRSFQLLSSPKESRVRLKEHSPSPRPDTMKHVEDVSKKLLSPDEVSAVMRHCQRFLCENVLEDLVRPLLAIFDRPEKLLLLREIRMLVPPAELARFDSLVMPFELEAYDALKSRSVRSPALRSPHTGTPRRHLITPIPDYRGGFHLQPAQDATREHQLIEELERLRVTGHQSSPSSRIFTPLLDIPVDSYTSSSPARSRSLSPSPNGSLLLPESPIGTQRGRQLHRSPTRRENGGSRSRDPSMLSDDVHERGRSPVRRSSYARERSPDSIAGRLSGREAYTEVSVKVPSQQREVFESPEERTSRQQVNGQSHNDFTGGETLPPEYDITTLTISKTKPSLGISISGGAESRVQPMIKIEKIFSGGAASTNNALKAGYELLSVDGESLEGVTHQHAVDVIRRSFSNKDKNPMVFMVKVPKVQSGSNGHWRSSI